MEKTDLVKDLLIPWSQWRKTEIILFCFNPEVPNDEIVSAVFKQNAVQKERPLDCELRSQEN